jgi:hypothetical protein
MEPLQHGRIYSFADWPVMAVPDAAGVYTIWRAHEFLYVGMAGRDPLPNIVSSASESRRFGLRSRLSSHASGRRSGDQFCIYVSDRLILSRLTGDQLAGIGTGKLSLDRMTRDFIRNELTFRFLVTPNGTTARRLEGAIKVSGLPGIGRPLLNAGQVAPE